MEPIGTKIHAMRRSRGLTQAQLADVLSVSAQTISKWENHLSAPDISMLPVIARYFGVTMDELFGFRLDALNYRERFIRLLAAHNALRFGQFTLRSGRISPWMIDLGSCQSASQIARLGEFYAECMRENGVEARLLMANTRKEIPIMIAASLTLFTRYGVDVRYSTDGEAGKTVEAEDRVTLIKDTLTSGDTLRKTLDGIQRDSGGRIEEIIVSVDRMERGSRGFLTARQELEREFDVKIHAIVTLDDVIRAIESGIVGGSEHLAAIKEYRDRYGGARYAN